ncbi:hypothetical protein [Terribacillus saccharophilus]|uniref:hypothetical protein n=1 Tax=Terribacillus saccharophilus TaxID=361277 RepID=UPI000C9BED3D|nr:hypothetical protein [Terribacillus goriensis]
MRTLTILIVIIAVTHISNLINVTLLDGEWSGIVIWLSTFLFLISMIVYGREVNRNRKNNSELGRLSP